MTIELWQTVPYMLLHLSCFCALGLGDFSEAVCAHEKETYSQSQAANLSQLKGSYRVGPWIRNHQKCKDLIQGPLGS